ncbi:PRAME family member 12 isoform X3 [Cricetulus griseus]|uniref:PRAME family member 12 isoform X3 n=1 Tax=Cricetulus griseus TaxID=10029 RepID=A0A9J7GRV5_CRIGR|nr:PRAME family member 12 isoform X3 [Cricetulus griseus]
MGSGAPPTLLQLAVKSLQTNENVGISGLQQLPKELFPCLFKEVFTNRLTEMLTAMVARWPFACLPVGALMNVPDVAILKAVLNGLDTLLTQQFHLRQSMLRVLDLRNVHNVFWDVWPGVEGLQCLEGSFLPRYAQRQLLMVVTDFDLRLNLDEHQAYLLQWAQQRQSSVRLCCLKMTICGTSLEMIRMVMKTFQPCYLEQLDLSTNWNLITLSRFAPWFGQMRNLRKLHVSHIYMKRNKEDIEQKCVARFISQISKLNCLQNLSMNGVYISSERMKQLFRCLKSPLETLSINLCMLSQADMKHLSQCQWIFQLKHLQLHGVPLFHLSTIHLQFLLEHIADTLEILELEDCTIGDSQISSLLPALRKCSKLTRVNLYDNAISNSVMKEFLQGMSNISTLTEEFYPAPLECYDELGHILVQKLAKLCPDLLDILRHKRHPKNVSFGTHICPQCFQRCVYDVKTRLCHCFS